MQVLRNWLVVCVANFAGAVGLAVLVYLSGHADMGSGAIGRTVVRIALAKQALPWSEAFFRGVLCNVLVCVAVWMAMAGRSVADKAVAMIFPITAFVAAGFEHSVANMYFVPFALFLTWLDPGFVAARGLDAHALTWGGFLARNLLPVTLGNVIGGAALVGGVYWFVYLRPRAGE